MAADSAPGPSADWIKDWAQHTWTSVITLGQSRAARCSVAARHAAVSSRPAAWRAAARPARTREQARPPLLMTAARCRAILGGGRWGGGRAGSSLMMLTGGIEADEGSVYLSGIGARVSPPVGAITPAAGQPAARRAPVGGVTGHIGVEGLLPDVVPDARGVAEGRNGVAALGRAALAPHQDVRGQAERVLLQRALQRRDRVIELRRCAGRNSVPPPAAGRAVPWCRRSPPPGSRARRTGFARRRSRSYRRSAPGRPGSSLQLSAWARSSERRVSIARRCSSRPR